jgi:hypothetical protein
MFTSGEDFPQTSPDPSQTTTPICTPSITLTPTPSITLTPTPSITPTSTPLFTPLITPSLTSSVEIIYVESDDVNPLHIHYEKDSATVVNEDDVEKIKRDFKPKKTYLRDVRSSKRRHT